MTIRHHIQLRIPKRFRRGFALPLVILLMLISSMTIVVIMQRQTAQTRLVETMITDYQTHHAAFGVRAIVRKWLATQRGQDLAEYTNENGDVSYRFILPNDVFVSIWVLDGQGIPVLTPTDIGPANVAYYREIVGRLRSASAISLRSNGPSFISIAAAPRAVLEALVEDEDQGRRLADRIITARERKTLDRQELMNQLRRAGLEDDEIARVITITTFDPVLWRINIMSEDRTHNQQRFFVMQTQIIASAPSVRSWEELVGVDPGDPFAEKPTKTNRNDTETADLNDEDQTEQEAEEESAQQSATR